MNRLKKLDKNFWLALPLLALLFYGVWAQFAAYRAGLIEPSPENAGITAVSGFSAEKPADGVIVAVSGAVRKKGYYALPPEMELRDFLAQVGLLADGDISAWDLAHRPEQGDQYYVADKSALDDRAWLVNESAAAEQTEPAAERLNINTATLEELQELPGIGPSRAQAIINYRVEHNGFRYVEELMGVSGIGEKIFSQLENRITV